MACSCLLDQICRETPSKTKFMRCGVGVRVFLGGHGDTCQANERLWLIVKKKQAMMLGRKKKKRTMRRADHAKKRPSTGTLVYTHEAEESATGGLSREAQKLKRGRKDGKVKSRALANIADPNAGVALAHFPCCRSKASPFCLPRHKHHSC